MTKMVHWALAFILVASWPLAARAGDTHGGGPKVGSAAVSTSGLVSATGGSSLILGDASVDSGRLNSMTVSDADRVEMSYQQAPRAVRSLSLVARLKLYLLLTYTLYNDFFF